MPEDHPERDPERQPQAPPNAPSEEPPGGPTEGILGTGGSGGSGGWAAYALGIPLLLWPAIWNGQPLITPDTDRYLTFHLAPHHPPFYQALAATGALTRSLWPVVTVQSALMIWLLRALFRQLAPDRPAATAILLAALAIGTSLPWLTSQVLAGTTTPILVLTLYLLLTHGGGLTSARGLGLAGLFLWSLLCHGSHLPIAAPLIVATALLAWIARRRNRTLRIHWRAAGGLLLAATAVLCATSAASWGRMTPSIGGPVILLARLVQDGPATRTLRRECPERPYQLCKYLPHLPMASERFLWTRSGPVADLGFVALSDEAPAILWSTLRAEPAAVARGMLLNAATQLVTFDIGGGFRGLRNMPAVTARIDRNLDHDVRASPQFQGTLPLARLRPLHRAVLALSTLALFVLAGVALRHADLEFLAFAAFVTGAVLLNAAVTGALAIPFIRYGARIVWLVPLAAGLGLLRLFPAPTRDDA